MIHMEHKRKRASFPSDDSDKPETKQLLGGKFEEPHEEVPQMVGAVQYAAAVRATNKIKFPSTKVGVGGSPPIQIRVPSEKVCFVVGPGGKTLKDPRRRSGAFVKVIPRHLAEGDQPRERTVSIFGGEMRVEMAKAVIKEALNRQPLPCKWDNHFVGTVFEDKQLVPCDDLTHCISICAPYSVYIGPGDHQRGAHHANYQPQHIPYRPPLRPYRDPSAPSYGGYLSYSQGPHTQ